jgi:hypothetical protein
MNKKKYQNRIKVTINLLDKSDVTEERIKKDMIRKLVEDIPIEKLEQIYHFTTYNPFEDVNWYELTDIDRQKLKRLRDEGTIEYITEIEI